MAFSPHHPFEVLAHPIRRRIVEVLASGEHAAENISGLITVEFAVTRSTVSHHLKILRDDRWVRVRPDWANRYYMLEEGAFIALDLEVRRLHAIWERRIGWMARNEPKLEHVLPLESRFYPRESFAMRRLRRDRRRDKRVESNIQRWRRKNREAEAGETAADGGD